MIRALALAALLTLPLPAWSRGPASAPLPADQAERCRYGARHMIEFGRRSLDEAGARSERTEKRRRHLEEWSARLERGEDPCAVYLDIQKAATTF